MAQQARVPLPDTQELLKTGLKAGALYLGDPVVVDGLVRELMKAVTDAREKQHTEGADIIPPLTAAAEHFANVFMGKDKAYLAYAWNRPEYLGAFLVGPCGMEGSPDDAVLRLAWRIIEEVANILPDYEDDKLTDEQMQDAISTIVETYRSVLAGTPRPQ